jgi:hypothetical protein
VTYLLVALIVWAVFSVYYIRRLKAELHTHEAGWNQIEEISDHNKDGDVVIHIQHLPEVKPGEVRTIPLNREPRSPADVFRNPPKFSKDQDKDSW